MSHSSVTDQTQTSPRLNKNPMTSLESVTQDIDLVHWRKAAAIFNSRHLEMQCNRLHFQTFPEILSAFIYTLPGNSETFVWIK